MPQIAPAVYPPRGKSELAEPADAILAFTYGGMTLAKALHFLPA